MAHATSGRTRLRLARAADAARLQDLVDAAAGCAGVSRVVGRPNTGSLIVEHAGDAEALLSALETLGVAKRLAPPPAVPLDQAARLGLARVDAEIGRQTDGALGFRSALAAALILAAAFQASRGRVAGPATTLVMSALSLLDDRRR